MVCHAEEQIIASIRQSQEKLAACIGTAHLPEHISTLLRKIFEDKDFGGMTGKDLDGLRESIINHKAKDRYEEIKGYCEEFSSSFKIELIRKEAILLNEATFTSKKSIPSKIV